MSDDPAASWPPFGEIVRFHRRRAGLTQPELARIAGVGRTVVLDVEKGKVTVRLTTLLKLLDALNVRLDWSSPLKSGFADYLESRNAPRPNPRTR